LRDSVCQTFCRFYLQNIFVNSFGENLKREREFSKLSQKDFAEKIGTTQQRVSEWERDKVEPTLYNIIAILKALNITFEELVSE